MGGAFRAIGRVVGGAVRGIGSVVGGVVKGAGQLLTGQPLKALGSVVGGVVKGTGHVLKGGLGAVKDVLGDPLIMGVAGFATGGIFGAMAGPMLGKLGAGIFGAAEQGVGNLFGINGQQGCNQMAYQNNCNDFGGYNGSFGAGGCGGTYGQPPYGGYGDYGNYGGGQCGQYGPPQFPGSYGPSWPGHGQGHRCCCPCQNRFY